MEPIVSAHIRTLDRDVIFSGYKIPAKVSNLLNTLNHRK